MRITNVIRVESVEFQLPFTNGTHVVVQILETESKTCCMKYVLTWSHPSMLHGTQANGTHIVQSAQVLL